MTELATSPVEERTGTKRISHWIGGRIVAGESGRRGAVYNPATGRQTGAVDFATAEEVDRAVQSAKEAFPRWRAVSLAKRAELFFRIRELVHERREEAAKLLTAEHGKVLSDAIGEVTRGLEVVEFCCGLPTLLKSEYSEQASTGIDVYAIKERIPKVKVGNGMDPTSEMGPLVTREHRDKVASYVENAPGEGAKVLVDGREDAPEEGFFLRPSLLD